MVSDNIAGEKSNGLLRDRVVLITGASRGIGAATAKLLALHRASVAVNYLQSADAAQEVVRAIETEGGKAIAVRADVTKRDEVEAMVRDVDAVLGPIDTLVLNAAISFTVAPFLQHKWEDFEAKILGELKAAFYPAKAIVPSMVARKQGCVIAISSVASRMPSPSMPSHSSAKAGLDALMRALAAELGPIGIRVNVISPGLTLTDASAFQPSEVREAFAQATPLKRNALPEDVARAVLLLASQEAGFITGTYLPVSGGMHMV